MQIINLADFYWYVAGDTTRAYSSKIGDYVASTDPTFQSWLAVGNMPQNIDSEANLGQVLAQNLLRPVAANVLDGYTGAQADTVLSHLVFKVLFNHENRIRVLEGKLPITAQQARAAVKALM